MLVQVLAGSYVRIGWIELLRRTAREIYQDNCLGLAAQLAYYFFLALFPALLFLVALASFFPLERLVPRLVDTAGPFLPEDVVAILRDQISKLSGGNHGGVLTFGFLAALWSSSAAMTAIMDALNRAYDVEEGRPWWRVRLTAIGLTAALALFVLLSFAFVLAGPELVARVLPWLGGSPWWATVWGVARWPLAFALIALGIGLIYNVAPDVEQDWVSLTPGSLGATVAWILASVGFRDYIIRFGNYTETYGAIGGVMVLLLWLYVTGLVVLAGAELNSEIEHAAPTGKATGEKVPGERARAEREPVFGQRDSGAPAPAGAATRAGWLVGGLFLIVGLASNWLVKRLRAVRG